MIFGSNTILNYDLSQKLKLIEIGKFNHLINTLTMSTTISTQLDEVQYIAF
jgi:hypothetical protein